MCLVEPQGGEVLLEAAGWTSLPHSFRKARSWGDFAALNDASDTEADACIEPGGLPAKRRAGSTENLLKLEALAKTQAAAAGVPVLGSMALKLPSRVRVSFELPEPAERPSTPPEPQLGARPAAAGPDCDNGHCQACTLGTLDVAQALEQRLTAAAACLLPGGRPFSPSPLPLSAALEGDSHAGVTSLYNPPPPSAATLLPPLPAPVAPRPCSLFTLVEPPSLITPSPSSAGASPPSSYSCASPFCTPAASSPFSGSVDGMGGSAGAGAFHGPLSRLKHSQSEEALSCSHLAAHLHEPPAMLLDPAASLGTAYSLDLPSCGSGALLGGGHAVGSADSLPLSLVRSSTDSFVAASSSCCCHLSEGSAAEELFYRLNHARQTVDFVKRQAAHFSTLSRAEMDVWEALATLDTLREYETALLGDDDCDPTMGLLEHALQTAEACRLAYPDDDWLHLVGLIHDLGKLLAHNQWGSEPQWAVCGETYPVGCRFHPSILHSQFFSANPDRRRRAYSTTTGMYQPGCGLNSVYMSWSAAEYLYMVLMRNKTQLPPEAMFVLRYHRCAVLLRPGAPYCELQSESDRRSLPWVKRFRELARYTRQELPGRLEGDALRDYYDGLINKYLPQGRIRW